MDALLASLPGFAKDLKLNLERLLLAEPEQWQAEQRAAVAVACVAVLKDPGLARAVDAWATQQGVLSAQALDAARTAGALMAMTNVYYRFVHLAGTHGQTPARLRMNGMNQNALGQEVFELASLAVSALHGCGRCIAAHEAALAAQGVDADTRLQAVRLAAVLHAVAAVRASRTL